MHAMSSMLDQVVSFIKELYKQDGVIQLHEPMFTGNEKKYLTQCIDSTFVSSIGPFVEKFENGISRYASVKHAIATVNGTSALHIALLLAGVRPGDEAITQPLSFVATANAIRYAGANPIFVDVDRETLSMSPARLEDFLDKETIIEDDGLCYNKKTRAKIKACIPVHVLGHPLKINKIVRLCNRYHIPVIEDAAAALGSKHQGNQVGSFGDMGIFSFNGNKIITCGGGGIIVTNNDELAEKAKHITTTAKIPHKWEISHNMIGYNYRLPNLNAALGYAQLEKIDVFLENKRQTAAEYLQFFSELGIKTVTEPKDSYSNYWLNAVIMKDKKERELFIGHMYNNKIMTRPIWKPLNRLPMYELCQASNLENSEWLAERIVCLPSSVRA